MIKPVLAALAAAPLLIASTAIAETQSERDARRSSYVAGYVCHMTAGGQSVKLVYRADGTGDAYHQEAPLYFTWSVKEDRFCVRVEHGDNNCSDLPPRDIGDERRKFLEMLGRNCT